MRAGIYAAMDAKCARVRLYHLAQTPAGRRTLDVGIYKNRHWRVKVHVVVGGGAVDLRAWLLCVFYFGQGVD